MIYGENEGAKAWLIGEENRGLAAMFVMMNAARLAVGTQGVGVGERAYQQALAFARDRRQGRGPKGGDGMAPIIEHADIQRMLMTMKANVQAARGICHLTAASLDLASHGRTAEARAAAADRAALLTPIAKAFSSDIGDEAASLGVQIHGGMGFIEETGAAQHMRDSRIAAIYEGANGVQAIDLVQRKLPLDGGETVRQEIAGIREVAQQVDKTGSDGFGGTAAALSEAASALDAATRDIHQWLQSDPQSALAGASQYLRLFGLTLGGACLAKAGLAAEAEAAQGNGGELARSRSRPFLRQQAAARGAGHRARHRGGRGAAARLRSHSGGQRMTQGIEVRRDGAVMAAAFNRPEKKNAITSAMYETLIEVFDKAARDPEVGALVLSGNGGVFTAGNDIGDFLAAATGAAGPRGIRDAPAWRFISTARRFRKAAGRRGPRAGRRRWNDALLSLRPCLRLARRALPHAFRQSGPRSGGRRLAARPAALRPRQGVGVSAACRAFRRRDRARARPCQRAYARVDAPRACDEQSGGARRQASIGALDDAPPPARGPGSAEGPDGGGDRGSLPPRSRRERRGRRSWRSCRGREPSSASRR